MRVLFRNLIFVAVYLFWIGSVSASDWQTEIEETEALIAQAESTGGLWRDTEKLLGHAKEHYTKGNYKDASAL